MPMYNQLVKEEYINYYMSISQFTDVNLQRQQVEAFFSRLGKVEQSFDVDIADADYETAILILNQVGKGGARNDSNKLSMCKQYINWAIETGHTRNFENKIDNITSENLDKSAAYRATMVKDEKELVDYLDVCFLDINSDSIDLVFRTYAVLIFNGVEPKLVPHLLSNSVDLSKKTVFVNNTVVDLSETACVYIDALNNIQEYIVSRGDRTPRIVQKVNTGHILENSSSNRENFAAYCRSKLSAASREYYKITHIKRSLSSNCIYKSGLFYRAWLQETTDATMSARDYFMRNSMLLKSANNKLPVEYANWKKAFNL